MHKVKDEENVIYLIWKKANTHTNVQHHGWCLKWRSVSGVWGTFQLLRIMRISFLVVDKPLSTINSNKPCLIRTLKHQEVPYRARNFQPWLFQHKLHIKLTFQWIPAIGWAISNVMFNFNQDLTRAIIKIVI